MIRYVFFGSPVFASIVLETLIRAGFPPVAVVANPDKPFGRKKIITPPQTKDLIYRLGLAESIKIFQPEKIDEVFLNTLKSLGVDFYVVAAYAKILPKKLLDIPPLGVVGVHPSLLPKYRGSSPIQTALLNCDKETGVALFMVDEKVDNGPLLVSSTRPISTDDDYVSLERKLAETGGRELAKMLPTFAKKEVKAIDQDHTQATYTRKFKTEDGFVDYEAVKKAESGDKESARRINGIIKALNPEPGAYTLKDGKRIKLLKSAVLEDGLVISEVQFEGKNPRKLKEPL